MLRITGGIFRGIRIETPKGVHTRPSTEVLRKAVFDICQPIIKEASFLDLFAGSGAFGIEALSRGAKKVTFVEQNLRAIQCIRNNLSKLNLKEKGEIIFMDSNKWLNKNEATYDIVFMDPPYQKISLYTEVLQKIDQKKLAKFLFVETNVEKLPLPSFHFLQLKESRRYANSYLFLFLSKESSL